MAINGSRICVNQSGLLLRRRYGINRKVTHGPLFGILHQISD